MRQLLATLFASLIISACDQSIEPRENGLSGYWSFNDEFTVDNSGNGNDAISHGAEADDGIIGRAANLKGSGYLEIPDDGAFGSYDRSFSVWIYKATSSITAGYEAIAWKGPETGADVAFGLALENTSPPFRLTLSAGDGADGVVSASTGDIIEAGEWHHVLAVVSPIEVTLFVDGRQESHVENTGGFARNSAPLLLGRVTENASAARYFNGRIDEVRYYDRSLGLADAQALFAAGK